MRNYQKSSGITVFFLAIISMLVVVSGARADLLVAADLTSDTDGVIRRFDNSGNYIGTFTSGGPTLDGPSALRFGPDGNLYVLSGSSTVIRYNGRTGVYIDTFISSGLSEAKNMVFGPDGNLYISANPGGGVGEGGTIMRFNGTTGAFIDNFVANGAGTSGCNVLAEAMALVFGPDGKLYVGNDARDVGACGTSYSIMRFNGQTGAYIDTPVPANAQGLYDPNGMTVGPDGNIYISSEGTSFTYDGFGTDNPNVIYRLNPTTNVLTQLVTSNGLLDINGSQPHTAGAGLIEPEGIVFGPDGNLYVSSGDTAEVYRYNGTTGALIGVFAKQGLGAASTDPVGLTFFPSDYVKNTIVPTMSEWGMILFMTLAGIGSIFHLRRQRRSQS
jgi:outer membrane protein assembly factor BamB